MGGASRLSPCDSLCELPQLEVVGQLERAVERLWELELQGDVEGAGVALRLVGRGEELESERVHLGDETYLRIAGGGGGGRCK
jgi:hypothetical protein